MLKDIGPRGPRIQEAFVDMDVIGYADADLEALVADDEAMARELDAARDPHLAATVEVGAASESAR